MKKYFFILMCFLLMIISAGCSHDDEISPTSLHNQWGLVSYVNATGEVQKEAKGYNYQVTFNSDGTYSGLAYGNKISGKYTCVGNRFEITDGNITQMDVEGADPDKFFLEYWSKVYTYTITDSELRLYYSEGQYFKFRIKDK